MTPLSSLRPAPAATPDNVISITTLAPPRATPSAAATAPGRPRRKLVLRALVDLGLLGGVAACTGNYLCLAVIGGILGARWLDDAGSFEVRPAAAATSARRPLAGQTRAA